MDQISALNKTIFQFQDIRITPLTIIGVIVAFILAKYLNKFIHDIVFNRYMKEKEEGEKLRMETIYSFVQYLIYLLVFIIILNVVGVQLTVLIAAFSALMIGVGIGLQNFFADLTSGIVMIFEKIITVGDVVSVDGAIARVKSVGLRGTTVITRDYKVIIVPNSYFVKQPFYNWTQNSYLVRSKITIGVAYGSDTALVKDKLIEAALEVKEVSQRPKPVVLFADFADSSLNFELYYYSNNVFNEMAMNSQIRFNIDRLFREANISIPFPQRDVHLISNE